jgi:hypothetical protein
LKETNIVKGRLLREYIIEKGLPCVEEIMLGKFLINLWRPPYLWEDGNFFYL